MFMKALTQRRSYQILHVCLAHPCIDQIVKNEAGKELSFKFMTFGGCLPRLTLLYQGS
jgi:hypothetical protein